MPNTFSKYLSATIRLGVHNGNGPQEGLCDAQPTEIRTKFCKNYTSEYPAITDEVHKYIQKHYYLDVQYGKNEFLYVSKLGDNADERNFRMSVTVAGKPVFFENIGTKLRILSQDLDFKSFNACFLGQISEAKLITLSKVLPESKRTDLIFGPNCKGIVKLFKKAGVEDLSDSDCWESELNLKKAILDENYVSSDENKMVSKLLGKLFNFYKSPEFEKKCNKKDSEADTQIPPKFKNKSIKQIMKNWHNKINFSE